jgi:hypothetical protein
VKKKLVFVIISGWDFIWTHHVQPTPGTPTKNNAQVVCSFLWLVMPRDVTILHENAHQQG